MRVIAIFFLVAVVVHSSVRTIDRFGRGAIKTEMQTTNMVQYPFQCNNHIVISYFIITWNEVIFKNREEKAQTQYELKVK